MGVIGPSERAEGEEDEIAWDPAWDDEDEELDTAAAQIAEDEVLLRSRSRLGRFHSLSRHVA